MSSIPTRRTQRATAGLNENANARPSRLAATRSKPATAGSSSTATAPPAPGQTRATAPTAASRARAEPKAETAAGKRKREALGEVTGTVTNNHKLKAKTKTTRATGSAANAEREGSAQPSTSAAAPASKDTADGVVTKSSKTTTVSRQPLRTVAGPAVKRVTRHAAAVAATIKEEEAKQETDDEDAMVVDPPVVAVARRLSTRRSVVAAREAAPPPTAVPARRRSTRAAPPPKQEEEEDEEEVEEHRVKKKARTSSEAPVEYSEDVVHDAVVLHDEENMFDDERAEHEVEEIFDEEEAEADPDGPDWVDLDEEDHDDPLMVSEYVVDIFNYMKEVELDTMANPNYMETQKELAWKMRGILTDWLVQVHVRFRLLPETLFLAVNIIDRFLSARVVSLAKLQLVGVTCMFIAAKYEEIMAPSVQNFHYCADSTYEEKEILQAERYVLKTLDWNLSYPNPVHYLRRVSKADEYDVQVRTVAKYLLEIGCLEWRLISAPPSLMAAAAIWFARIVLGRETPNLAHYSSYAESAIVPTANLMLNYVLKPVVHESFHKKYASKKYYKASVNVRKWATDRWAEDSHVDLAAELPALKAQIREARELEPVAPKAAEDTPQY